MRGSKRQRKKILKRLYGKSTYPPWQPTDTAVTLTVERVLEAARLATAGQTEYRLREPDPAQ